MLSCLVAITGWQKDYQTAKTIASEKHQLMLLNFSGSDWCGPCIRMHKDIFSNSSFLQMADTSLVMYNADFPRNKKNVLPPLLKKQNESLADRYSPEGNFPLTLLISENGSVIKSWVGLPTGNAADFASVVKSFCNSYKKTYD
ncbi:MAG: thioredoxin family protein [Chitinophagaceae bacterium]|nr:MAG: thioredoxin family protein [Chitinophagaceae bacterium]